MLSSLPMLSSLQLGPDAFMWSQSTWAWLVTDVSPTKRSFYSACNSILAHSNNLDDLV